MQSASRDMTRSEAGYGLGKPAGLDEHVPQVHEGSRGVRGCQKRLLVAPYGGVDEPQVGQDDAQVVSGLGKCGPQGDGLFVAFCRFCEETETAVGFTQVVVTEVVLGCRSRGLLQKVSGGCVIRRN